MQPSIARVAPGVVVVDPFECACGFEHNHWLLHSFLISRTKIEESAGVGVVHEVKLVGTVGIVGTVHDRKSLRTRGSRKEAIAILSWNHEKTVTTHISRWMIMEKE